MLQQDVQKTRSEMEVEFLIQYATGNPVTENKRDMTMSMHTKLAKVDLETSDTFLEVPQQRILV